VSNPGGRSLPGLQRAAETLEGLVHPYTPEPDTVKAINPMKAMSPTITVRRRGLDIRRNVGKERWRSYLDAYHRSDDP
jgi:hypothetical protein